MFGIIKSLDVKSYKKIAEQSFPKSLVFLVLFIVIISAALSLKFTLIVRTELSHFIPFLD